jgi:ribosomal protein S18 acetylase RimI-like enzyme
MALAILNARGQPSDADLVRLFHRTDAAWTQHLADGEQLDVGTAYVNRELPNVWNANNVRDAALADGMSPAEAVAQVQSHYAARGPACAYWIMNPSANVARTAPLADHLLATGHRARLDDILYLRSAHTEVVATPPGLRIIPARASYRHARALAHEDAAESWGGRWVEQRVEADIRHLDDAHTDTLLALRGDQAVATISILMSGDMGQIENVYVSAAHRRQGIGRLMLGCALEVCARSLFHHVFILVEPTNRPAVELYRSVGFEPLAQLTRYCAPHVM